MVRGGATALWDSTSLVCMRAKVHFSVPHGGRSKDLEVCMGSKQDVLASVQQHSLGRDNMSYAESLLFRPLVLRLCLYQDMPSRL